MAEKKNKKKVSAIDSIVIPPDKTEIKIKLSEINIKYGLHDVSASGWTMMEQLGLLAAVHGFDKSKTKEPDAVDWDTIVNLLNKHKVARDSRKQPFEKKMCKDEYTSLLAAYGSKYLPFCGDEPRCSIAFKFFLIKCELEECRMIAEERERKMAENEAGQSKNDKYGKRDKNGAEAACSISSLSLLSSPPVDPKSVKKAKDDS